MSESAGGRHSSNNQTAFYRSAVQWFLPWLIVGVVAIGAIWIAVDALGNDAAPESDASNKEDAPAAVGASPSDEPSEEEVESEPTETPESDASDKDKSGKDKSGKDNGDTVELITENISIQVLNGTNDSTLDDGWADKLQALGFEIEVVNPYLSMEETVVYWSSSESREAAEALGERFDWPAEAKPSELSAEVSIHVYLGEDEL